MPRGQYDRTKSNRVFWSDEEWDKLADILIPMRVNDPLTPLSGLIDKAMSQFPADRRRKIINRDLMKPLIERMQKRFGPIKKQAEEAIALRHQLNGSSTKPKDIDAMLDEMSPDEAKRRFGRKVLQALTAQEVIQEFPPSQLLEEIPTPDLVGETARRMAADLLDSPLIREMGFMQKPKTITLPGTRQRQPKVVVVGGLTRLQSDLNSKLSPFCDLYFSGIGSDTETEVPSNADLYFVFTKLVRHHLMFKARGYAKPGGIIYYERTGMEGAVEAIQLWTRDWYEGAH